jgi:UDP-glucose 4-epimerase
MDPRAVRPTVVRLFDTIGPRKARSRDLVGGFVRQALAGECLTVPGTGEQRRCFTHVFDVVEALMLLCDHTRAAGGAYEIGNPAAVSILELAERVLERTGSNSPIRLVPEVAAPEAGLEERGLDVPDTAPLHALTGWTPRQTLDAAIEDVIVHQSAARLSLN